MNVDQVPEFQSNQANPSEGRAKIAGFRILDGYSRIFHHLTHRSSQLWPAWSLARIKRLLLTLFPIFFLSFVVFSWLNARYTNMAVSRTQVASDLLMHSQRLGKAAPNAIQGNQTAFHQLAQSRNATFNDILMGFLEGSPVLRLPATTQPDARARLIELQAAFENYRRELAGTLSNIKKFIAAKNAERILFQENEPLREQLINLQLGYREQEQTSSWTSWGLTLSGVFTLLLAAGVAWTLLMESRRKAAQAEHNRIEAESRRVEAVQEETVARQINQQNQAAILRLMNELQEIAEGNLTVKATVSEDVTGAIADSVNVTLEELCRLLAKVRKTALQVGSSCENAQQMSTELLSLSARQSTEIQQTGQMVLQLSDMAGTVLADIRRVSQHLAELITDISSSALQQASVSDSVSRNIDSILTVTEHMGKPKQGLVLMKLSEQGAELRLQVSDDGRGLNFVRIREQAIARGLLSANAEPDTDSLTQLIFESGFSTAEQVTGLAGRGIGMDAVKATIVSMGGAIKVESQSGLGTSVIMALPKSSSTQKIVLVSDAHQKIALPSAMVQQVLTMTSANAKQATAEGFLLWQDKKIALCALSDLIREPTATHSASDRISFLILHQLDDWIAVKVGEVHGHHEVVVKPPGPQLASVPGLMGAAMLPDGDILLVMNLLQLHAHAVSNPFARSIPSTIVPEHVPPLVLVVDDSLTVRRVSQRMLEKQGYGVALARHGAHALELLSQISPAAVLLDIEMPTMDGFELLSRLRSDERFRELPVAMITSRMSERHRQHAMHLGANAYFGKPYREQELLEWLAQCAPVKKLTTPDNRTNHKQTLTSTV